jgi:hypothetical protein
MPNCPVVIRFAFGTIVTVAVWVALFLISRFLQRRHFGRWPVRYKIDQPPFALSIEACVERRRAVEAHLRQYSREDGIALEFIERPPGSRDVVLRELRNEDPARFWLISRLRMQLENDQYLLLERVTDALVCLERLGRITPEQFPYLIRLEKSSAGKAENTFPWRVVVACDEPDKVFVHFDNSEMREWLGVGVDFVSRRATRKQTPDERPPESNPPTAAEAFGRCSVGNDGLEGTVGGAIEKGGKVYGVTCRHVLSSRCGSIEWPTPPVRPVSKEFTYDCPDVAFIRLDSGCFDEPGHSRSEIAIPGTQSDLEEAVVRQTRLRKWPQRDTMDGVVVTAVASGFKLGKHFYRGPHFEMTPYFVSRFGISFPVFRRFSKGGDSGSWILEQTSQKWFGMIVGGYEPPVTCSVAISAEYINDAFSRYQMAHGAASSPTQAPCTSKAFV